MAWAWTWRGVMVYWDCRMAPSWNELGGTSHYREGPGVCHPRDVGGSTKPESTEFGLLITDSGTSGEVVEANLAGLRANGSAALANGLDGVAVSNASGNTIGSNILA